MRVVVTTEARFDQTEDGRCWTIGWPAYEFWTRYLDVFEHVTILARVRRVTAPPPHTVRVDGPQVSLGCLPYYLGPWEFIRSYGSVRAAAERSIGPADAVILRAPGATTAMTRSIIGKGGRPFGVEVVGDPEDVFAPAGGVRTVLRPVLRFWMARDLRNQCRAATAVAYVTTGMLQRRYPASPRAHVTNYSSITLPESAFADGPRAPRSSDRKQRLLFVGSLEQLYKAPDVLIDAVGRLVAAGVDLELTMVGDGKYRPQLERQAANLGISSRVRFTGHVPAGEAVVRELQSADLFVLPSLTEGLPRALIEAMALGLPCVGTKVGGIPELLDSQELVPPGDAEALAQLIGELLADASRCARLSRENLAKAREYSLDVLRPRRRAFYEALKTATAEWQRDARG